MTDTDELLELSHAWMQAVQDRDAETLERLVAPDFHFTAPHLSPEPMSREQWMAAALTGYDITTFAFLETDVVIDGDTGIVHSRYSQIASLDTTDLSNVFRLTDVWSRRDGAWRVLARHSSVLA